MAPTFLPYYHPSQADLLGPLSRIGPIIVSSEHVQSIPPYTAHIVHAAENDSIEQLVTYCDAGADQIIVSPSTLSNLAGAIPQDRLIVLVDNVESLSTTLGEQNRKQFSGLIVKTDSPDIELVAKIHSVVPKSTPLYLWSTSDAAPTTTSVLAFKAANTSLVVNTAQLTTSDTSPQAINVADVFLASITSDRPDKLFPTVVSTQLGVTIGMVYSSVESVRESIVTGRGVYQSRKHGLWRKGETSGATQQVVSIKLDCDSDAIEFKVIQSGAGFCHLDTTSCFGRVNGISALESTLKSRFQSAPEGSYTKRLFQDASLLRSKIMEEADELCRAETKEDVAFEAADLIYFALTKCIAAGVDVVDIERSLDAKAKKISRRPGNAKPQFAEKPAGAPDAPVKPPQPPTDGRIQMSTNDLSTITPGQRRELLLRPTLKSDQMIEKVKPIVEAVRQRGDAALLEFTAKFDRATLTSVVERPPYATASMQLDPEIRAAIDVAYSNIRKFHEAQLAASLSVETMPGVVCSRFSRPIGRVGLYVPGGTAILPSTALMLGIPAQVAGCTEIVLATPPRADGSISPEVMYVAHLTGATTVVKAGGAQAVAALAYGTESVPKVDKIFGPGNQWVTAAKMLVQNDTDALVAIDMPAGPSEVLVIADHTANPAFVAADLLSQAEHGIDSQVVLVAVALTPSQLSAIENEVDKQANSLSRVEILRQSVAKSIIVKANTYDEAIGFSNDYAPEHLILHLENAPTFVSQITNAGSVFVGAHTPESCGDYASGTNHTLPTNGYARQFSGVNTQSFQKHITCQEITPDGLRKLGPIVATLADCEGLSAHANAVRVRLATLG